MEQSPEPRWSGCCANLNRAILKALQRLTNQTKHVRLHAKEHFIVSAVRSKERLRKETDMSKSEFIKLSGWAFVAGAFAFLPS